MAELGPEQKLRAFFLLQTFDLLHFVMHNQIRQIFRKEENMRVKVYGAGSIGNHLTQAFRRAGHEVIVVDPDLDALARMRRDIYPSRYGSWDSDIKLYPLGNEPQGGFDIIVLGTPPDVRVTLAHQALEEKPRALLLEKPLCGPREFEALEHLERRIMQENVFAFVGYDHAVSTSVEFMRSQLGAGSIGDIETIDVEFREYWGGIFAAHPWLSGPSDSYLGYTARGGGASGEHSHALHLWLVLANASGWKPVSNLSSMLHMAGDYDDLAAFTLRTGNGSIGRVVQDVLTKPPRKWARVQGARGALEWYCNGVPGHDVVRVVSSDAEVEEVLFAKKRPDDFFTEVRHIEAVLAGAFPYQSSPIHIGTGVQVMKILNTANVYGCRMECGL